MKPTSWFRRPASRTAPRAYLVCFPHAGGAASFYHSWGARIRSDLELLSVQYPGRENRSGEPLVDDLQELADVVARELEMLPPLPIALFGHSMGALVAHEVAHRLGPRVFHLVVSARYPEARPGVRHLLDDEMLWAEVRRLDGIPDELSAQPELRARALPILRNDFRAAEHYVPTQAEPLACPIDALVGRADRAVTPAEMEPWRARTTGAFALHVFEGDHFFLSRESSGVLALLGRLLAIP